ncbi:MAG: hypothetical protein H6564_16115 [Lewinellaceae bacterium]|nr:hypothetical protein [Lewinellaceae bacterium]
MATSQQLERNRARSTVSNGYAEPGNDEIVLAETGRPDYSGVLFAFREGAWKLEYIEGAGEELLSGRREPESLLLPHFNRLDAWIFPLYRFWKGQPGRPARFHRALVRLSSRAGRLLQHIDAEHGLNIEFCIEKGRLTVLSAQPITTPEEAEEVLTSANHKELLPQEPSLLMASIINSSGHQLFDYYRRLDNTLPPQAFLREAAGMPWINLSALLDMMVHWGLPTQLICRQAGAEDVYQVKLRPYRAFYKLPVLLKVARQYSGVNKRIERWLYNLRGRFALRRQHREILWEHGRGSAFREWEADFRQLYVELVRNMQILSAVLSAPIGLLDRLGLLARLPAALEQKSASADYLEAFRELRTGLYSRETFLSRFGHRGFYESDIGQKRFFEFSEAEWQQLIGYFSYDDEAEEQPRQRVSALLAVLLQPVIRLIHTQEWLRNETMKLFWDFRRELLHQTEFNFWEYSPKELKAYFNGQLSLQMLRERKKPALAGWDMDTFLCNRNGRRLPAAFLSNLGGRQAFSKGIGIYPGKVEGRVWRVNAARPDTIQALPFEKAILVADALDPGCAPFFSQMHGVISYTGGLLSHASNLLRESRIPAITQIPSHIELYTGDRIRMDGQTGEVTILVRVEESEAASQQEVDNGSTTNQAPS